MSSPSSENHVPRVESNDSNRKTKVLAELHAICLTLESISDMLDDLACLTAPPSPLINQGRDDNYESFESSKNKAGSAERTGWASRKARLHSVAEKQQLLLEELERWQEIARNNSRTCQELDEIAEHDLKTGSDLGNV